MPENRRNGSRPDRRAQSEVLGFILVFALVILAIALVTVFGVTALGEVREASVADNGEFAMQSLESNFEELFYGTTTKRTTELTVESASLETGAPATVTIEGISSTSLPSGPVSKTFRPVVYRSDGTDIVYENSMVIREQREGAVAASEPLLKLSNSVSIVPVVRTVLPSGADPQSVSGGTRQVTARTTGTERVVQTGGVAVEYTLELSSTLRVDVWKRVLNEKLDGVSKPPGRSGPHCQETPVDGKLECQFETQRLVVSVVTIEYTVE